MQRVLHFPAPRVGEKIRLPVSVSTARETYFVAVSSLRSHYKKKRKLTRRCDGALQTMPGKMDWAAGAQEVNFAMWPVFKALHADNLLTIAEVRFQLFLETRGPLTAPRIASIDRPLPSRSSSLRLAPFDHAREYGEMSPGSKS